MERQITKYGDFPVDWIELRLKDVGNIITGKTPPTEDDKNFGDDYFFVTPEDLDQGKYVIKTSRGLSQKGSAFSNPVKENSICVACIGYIGKIGIVKSKSFTNQQINCIEVYDEFDTDYIYYLVEQNAKRIESIAGITAVPQINKSTFGKFRFCLPHRTEQTQIANFLSTVDKTIQATKNSIAKLEKLKTSLMQNLLTGKMKPDGSWRTEDDFWIDDKFGKVPNGWKISYLKDVQDINRESLPASTDPNYILKYITIEAVFTDRIDFNKVPEYKFSEAPGRARRVIKKGDFIVSTVRPNLKGFARLQEQGDNWICSTGFATVSPIDNQVSNFYFFQILSFIGEKQFASFISGSNYPAVTDRDFKQLKVYEAPFEEQIEIAAKIESVVTIINKKQASINQLDKLKKSLMQNLLTGKVRLPQEALKQ